MDIQKEALSEFHAGNGSVGTTPQTLTGVSIPVVKHVVVRAKSDNANVITVSHSEADAANGFILGAGNQSPPIYINDTSKVWVRGGAASQNYSWVAV